MNYKNNGKNYKVESVACGGAIINVNGTSITDTKLMCEICEMPFTSNGYSVFVDNNELAFETFELAYQFATTKQKDTFSI